MPSLAILGAPMQLNGLLTENGFQASNYVKFFSSPPGLVWRLRVFFTLAMIPAIVFQ